MDTTPNEIHIMVDLETYDTKPSAVVLSFGACVITQPHLTFYQELDPTTQFERTVSVATKEWWAQQPMPVPIGPAYLMQALEDFTAWIKKFDREPIIWCKGTDFDTAILVNAYNQFYLPVPWKYNSIRDCRTVFKLTHWQTKSKAHNALQDALDQTEDLINALQSYGLDLV